MPTTDTPDVDDAGVEEITINPIEPLPNTNISDPDQKHITHNHQSDVEASQDNGIFNLTTYYTFKADIALLIPGWGSGWKMCTEPKYFTNPLFNFI